MNGTQLFMKRRKDSNGRKYLKVITNEGISGVLLASLIGGPFLTGFMLHSGSNFGANRFRARDSGFCQPRANLYGDRHAQCG
ncbi:hypothetical protein DL346_10975 [Paenibacillus montanisoli]|uniref:Uncharacterized protein n=1 Tax=Paenibacillus montanisoli TaxID=2081970 RepID=A0A328U783_9BACL|nr:hypothetical protein DL346_10975 [Paenibacillus montanisoli]